MSSVSRETGKSEKRERDEECGAPRYRPIHTRKCTTAAKERGVLLDDFKRLACSLENFRRLSSDEIAREHTSIIHMPVRRTTSAKGSIVSH